MWISEAKNMSGIKSKFYISTYIQQVWCVQQRMTKSLCILYDEFDLIPMKL